MGDPWDTSSSSPPTRHPPDQDLPKLEELVRSLIRKAAPYVGQFVFSWGRDKLADLKARFIPKTLDGEMGCMKACYNALGILYSPKVSSDLQKEVYRNARAQADAWARRNPDKLNARIDEIKTAATAKGQTLTDAQARWQAIDSFTSPWNSADHLFDLMKDKGLASEKVNAPNADVEKTLSTMTGGREGVYFYGLAVNDNHTVTLAVDRASDGSQKIYWLDQNNPKLSTEVRPGQLGAKLADVPGGRTSSNVWAFRPGS